MTTMVDALEAMEYLEQIECCIDYDEMLSHQGQYIESEIGNTYYAIREELGDFYE